jgi:hypothetical protein
MVRARIERTTNPTAYENGRCDGGMTSRTGLSCNRYLDNVAFLQISGWGSSASSIVPARAGTQGVFDGAFCCAVSMG